MKESMGVGGGYHSGYHGFQGELDQGKPKGTLTPPTGNLPLPPFGSPSTTWGSTSIWGLAFAWRSTTFSQKVRSPLLVVLQSHEEDYHHLLQVPHLQNYQIVMGVLTSSWKQGTGILAENLPIGVVTKGVIIDAWIPDFLQLQQF